MIIMLILILAIVAIYLFAISTRKPKKISKSLSPHLYAHRGLFDNANFPCENSLKAFELAVDSGYGIELDVQLTKDNIPVVFHDKSLKRLWGLDKNLCDLDYDEIKELKLPCGNKIPLFSEVLSLVDGNVPLIVEIKHHAGAEKTAKISYELLKGYEGVFCVESFDPIALLWYRKNAKHILRGQLSAGSFNKQDGLSKVQEIALKFLLVNIISAPNFIAYTSKNDNNMSMSLIKLLYKPLLAAFTLKSQKDLDQAFEKGYTMTIFEGFSPLE